jgi:hypothetical protein
MSSSRCELIAVAARARRHGAAIEHRTRGGRQASDNLAVIFPICPTRELCFFRHSPIALPALAT